LLNIYGLTIRKMLLILQNFHDLNKYEIS